MKYIDGKGKYQEEYELLFDKLIPSSGKTETEHGELLRLISIFIHELYENNLCNYRCYLNDYKELNIKLKKNSLTSGYKDFIDLLDTYIDDIKYQNEDLEFYDNNFMHIRDSINEIFEIIIKYTYQKEYGKEI